MPTHGDGITKAARLLVLCEVLEDWPDCPTAYTAAALGVTLRTAQRDRRELPQLSAAARVVRADVLAYRDPDWLTDDEVLQRYGYSHAYLYALGHRRPDLRRRLLGRRMWSRTALDEYTASAPTGGHGRRGARKRR